MSLTLPSPKKLILFRSQKSEILLFELDKLYYAILYYYKLYLCNIYVFNGNNPPDCFCEQSVQSDTFYILQFINSIQTNYICKYGLFQLILYVLYVPWCH